MYDIIPACVCKHMFSHSFDCNLIEVGFLTYFYLNIVTEDSEKLVNLF